MKCPKCLIDNPESKKFCRECGAKLSVVCSTCGAEVLPSDRFCGECGHDLREPEKAPPIDYSQPQSYTPKIKAFARLACLKFQPDLHIVPKP